MMKNICFAVASCLVLIACNSEKKKDVPTVGFIDAFEDATISRAKKGFTDALKENGYSEAKHTLNIEYKNAQGDIPTLTQIANYFISENVDLIATNTTLASITTAQKTKEIPIFMMVSPTPAIMKMEDANGKAQANLFGVVENLNYIDTSFSIISKVLVHGAGKVVVGMIYNQSEPQSVDALERIKKLAAVENVEIIALPLNNSADAQLVTKALLDKHINAFFANPDNTVFASFETIIKNCNEQGVPVFTSEAGLVERGAVAAFGADIYQWGHQAGEQAARFLKKHSTDGLKPEMVIVRKRVYNPDAARKFNLTFSSDFEALAK